MPSWLARLSGVEYSANLQINEFLTANTVSTG